MDFPLCIDEPFLSYNDNFEYRDTLRRVFCMNTSVILEKLHKKYPNFATFDEETRDELCFDNDAMDKGMNYIYGQTENCEVFREMYLIAAGFMLSENTDIGLAVLMSYDYFTLFYSVLRVFFQEGEPVLLLSTEFRELQKRLKRK